MNLMSLEDIQDNWARDCNIDPLKLDLESVRTPNLHQKYLDQLTLYKMKIFNIEKKYLEAKGVRSRYYNGQMGKEELKEYGWEQYQYKAPLKSEMERLLETDPILLDMKEKISYYTFCFEYAEDVLKALRDRNYQIKAAIDFMRFQAGS